MSFENKLNKIAKKHGWERRKNSGDGKKDFYGIYEKNKTILTITSHNKSLKVETHLHHPKIGPSRLTRYNLTEKEINLVFENPRVHTKKGALTR